jgi:hypothetical protein
VSAHPANAWIGAGGGRHRRTGASRAPCRGERGSVLLLGDRRCRSASTTGPSRTQDQPDGQTVCRVVRPLAALRERPDGGDPPANQRQVERRDRHPSGETPGGLASVRQSGGHDRRPAGSRSRDERAPRRPVAPLHDTRAGAASRRRRGPPDHRAGPGRLGSSDEARADRRLAQKEVGTREQDEGPGRRAAPAVARSSPSYASWVTTDLVSR